MIKRYTFGVTIILLLALVLMPPITVKAQSKTIVIPDNYPTITSAIGNATNGDTILVRSGTYEGPINTTIVLSESIKIIGENTENTIIKLYPAYSATWNMYWPQYSYTDAITITADSCSLQNLTLQMDVGGDITAQGNQFLLADNKLTSVKEVTLKGSNCRITNNVLDGKIVINGAYNQVDKNSAGFIQVVDGGSYNLVKNNDCKSLNLGFSSNNVFLENKVVDELGDWGISLHTSNNNFFYKNSFSGFLTGFTLRFSSNNLFKANTVTNCLFTDLNFHASDNNLFSINNFFANNTQQDRPLVFDEYDDVPTRDSNPNLVRSTNIWSADNLGNYWGDYQTKYPNAVAVDNTEVGNTPYIINDNNVDPYPLITTSDISTASIQLPDWATSLSVPSVAPTSTFPPFNPSPSPTVPEISWFVIVPLLLSLFSVAIVLRHRQQPATNNRHHTPNNLRCSRNSTHSHHKSLISSFI